MSATTTAIETFDLFRAPAGKTWHVAKAPGIALALDGFTTPPNVDPVWETGIDARAERHAKLPICRNCRAQVAKLAAVETDADASSDEQPVEKPKRSSAKKNGASKPRAALSKTDEKKLAEVADALSTGRGKLDRDAVVTVGRKLIKKAKGLRSSNPPVPAKLDRSDLPKIVAALDLPEDLLGRAKDAK